MITDTDLYLILTVSERIIKSNYNTKIKFVLTGKDHKAGENINEFDL